MHSDVAGAPHRIAGVLRERRHSHGDRLLVRARAPARILFHAARCACADAPCALMRRHLYRIGTMPKAFPRSTPSALLPSSATADEPGMRVFRRCIVAA